MSDLFLFRNAVRDMTRPRRLLVALLLILLPGLVTLLWRLGGPKGEFQPEMAYNTIASNLVFGFLLVILTVVNGTGVLSSEIEQKTIPYLLTRPVPRWRILLMKFLAVLVVVTVTMWLASVVTMACAGATSSATLNRLGRDILILPIGVLAYGALFLLLATLINRPLMLGLLFAFGWESWVPRMGGYFGRVSLMSYVRTLAPHPRTEAETVDISQMMTQGDVNPITSPMAWTVLLIFSLVALSLALMVFSQKEYVPREDAE